jgi:hypothetical protein
MTDVENPRSCPATSWTNAEWDAAFKARLDKWLVLPSPKPHILRYMHMTTNGFVMWRETGIVPQETRILVVLFPEFLNG